MSDEPTVRSDDLLIKQGHDFNAAETERHDEEETEDAEVSAVKPGEDGEADSVDEP